MPTKKVEQAAMEFSVTHTELMSKSDVFIAGYNYALSPLEQSENKEEWVSFETALPTTSDKVLCYTDKKTLMVGWYNTVHKWWLVDMNQSFGYENTKVLSTVT